MIQTDAKPDPERGPEAEASADAEGTDRPIVERMKGSGPSARQYQDIFVGSRSLPGMLLYELVFGVVANIPGALGYLLRKKAFPWLFRATGRGSLFGCRMVVRCPGRMTLGEHVIMDDGVVLDAKGDADAEITIGSNVWVGRGSILSNHNGRIRIGDRVSIGPFCNIASHSFVHVGSHVAIGTGCSILAGSHDSEDPDVPMMEQVRTSKGITIEDNVWLGTGAIILDGVTVGTGAIVGAGSVVNRDVPPMTVVLGNPARVVQKRESRSP